MSSTHASTCNCDSCALRMLKAYLEQPAPTQGDGKEFGCEVCSGKPWEGLVKRYGGKCPSCGKLGTNQGDRKEVGPLAGLGEPKTALVWTREKPNRAGWYWHRAQAGIGVASVYLAPWGFVVHFNGADRPTSVAEVGGFWAGPIPEPTNEPQASSLRPQGEGPEPSFEDPPPKNIVGRVKVRFVEKPNRIPPSDEEADMTEAQIVSAVMAEIGRVLTENRHLEPTAREVIRLARLRQGSPGRECWVMFNRYGFPISASTTQCEKPSSAEWVRMVEAPTPPSQIAPAPGLLCRTCNAPVAGMMEFTAAGGHAGHDIGAPEGHPLARPSQEGWGA